MYEAHYGLSRRPFENTPNPEFFFASRQHREALAALSYGVEACKGFMLLTGDVGAGKTFVLQSLKYELREKDPIFLEVTTPWITAEELFAELPKQLGMTGDIQWSSIDFQNELKDKLVALFKQDRRVVVLLDEAQQLPERTLEGVRLLSNYETENAKLIQIIFVGQNELHETLGKYSLRQIQQRITLSRSLHYLSELETRRYIRHRLLVSGSNDPIFTEASLTLIYRASLGSPRLINLICDNCLITGFAQKVKEIGPDIVRDVVEDLPIANTAPASKAADKPEPVVLAAKAPSDVSSDTPSQIANAVEPVVAATVDTPVKPSIPVTNEVVAEQKPEQQAEPKPKPKPELKKQSTITEVKASATKPSQPELTAEPARPFQSGDDIRQKHKYFDDARLSEDKSMGGIGRDESDYKRGGRGGWLWVGLLLLLPLAWGGAKWYENKEAQARIDAANERKAQEAILEQQAYELERQNAERALNQNVQTTSLFDQIRSEVDATIVRDIDNYEPEQQAQTVSTPPPAPAQTDAAPQVTSDELSLALDRLDNNTPAQPTIAPASPTPEPVSGPAILSPQTPSQSAELASTNITPVLTDRPATPGVWLLQGGEQVLITGATNKSYSLSLIETMATPPASPFVNVQPMSRHRIVQPGQTLSQIARATYGTWNDTVKDLVRESNPHLASRMDRLLRGDRINLPPLPKQALVQPHQDAYVIYAGTLSSGVKAMALVEALAKQQLSAEIDLHVVDSRNHYRIYLTGFDTQAQALDRLASLSFRHMPFVVTN